MDKVQETVFTHTELTTTIFLIGDITNNNHQGLMVEAVSISETSVNFYHTTRRNIPEDSHLHIRRIENLKSHPVYLN
jgi:hypothetical protein